MAVRPVVIWPDDRLRQPSVAVASGRRVRARALPRSRATRCTPRTASASPRSSSAIRAGCSSSSPSSPGGRDRSAAVLHQPRGRGTSDEIQDSEEGCLSFPEIYIKVKRPMRARVRATGIDGTALRGRRRGAARALPPARERSPDRQAARRLRRPAQAADDQEEAAAPQRRRRAVRRRRGVVSLRLVAVRRTDPAVHRPARRPTASRSTPSARSSRRRARCARGYRRGRRTSARSRPRRARPSCSKRFDRSRRHALARGQRRGSLNGSPTCQGRPATATRTLDTWTLYRRGRRRRP